ncbi:MAG: hypothetical protein HYU36_20635 [Planctomycetes bacterium]|nr:hypothetical protein [Planctomycetota bacterium]
MTSHERVACALARGLPDRIPFGDFCIDNRCAEAVLGRPTPIHNPALWLDRLSEGDWDGLVAQEAEDWVELALNIGLDWISVDVNGQRPSVPPRKTAADEWEWLGRTYTFDPRTRLMHSQGGRSISLEEEARRILSAAEPPPPRHEKETLEVVGRVARRLAEKRLDIPLAMRTHGCLSVHHRLELMALYPDAAEIYFRRAAAPFRVQGVEAIAMGVSILTAGGHLGGNRTSLISPSDFRRFILPVLQEQVRAYHQRGARVCVASGGCVWPFAEAFLVESSADGYWGIDTYAGMDLVRLRDLYGRRVCLVGGVDSVHTLTRKRPSDVREETRRTLECFKDWPGFMLSSSNSIHNDVPPENFLAMVNAYRDFYGA